MDETSRSSDQLELRGSVVATTYVYRDQTFGHHVRALVNPEDTNGTIAGYACVEHLTTNCHACGRTAQEHDDNHKLVDELWKSREIYAERTGDCIEFQARPACNCDLPRGQQLP